MHILNDSSRKYLKKFQEKKLNDLKAKTGAKNISQNNKENNILKTIKFNKTLKMNNNLIDLENSNFLTKK